MQLDMGKSNTIWNMGEKCIIFLHIVMLYLEKKRNHWKTFINIEGKIQ